MSDAPGLVDRLENKIRRHILGAIPTEAASELEAMDLASLLHVYGNWRVRHIAPRPRAADLSKRLREEMRALPDPRLDHLIEKIERGGIEPLQIVQE